MYLLVRYCPSVHSFPFDIGNCTVYNDLSTDLINGTYKMLQQLVETKLFGIERQLELLKGLDLDSYCQSTAFLLAYKKFQAKAITADSSAHLYDDVDFQLIETFQDWTAAFISPHVESTAITSSPTFSIVKPLHLSGKVFFDLHKIEKFPKNGDIPSNSKVVFLDSQPVLEGKTFAISSGEITTTLKGAVKGSVFLRISGPIRTPIVLSFDRKSLEFISVSFSDTESTGKHFFTHLIDNYIKSAETTGVQIKNEFKMNLDEFLENQLYSDIHLFTKWKIMQILARTKKKAALDFLIKLQESQLPNVKDAASKALDSIRNKSSN